MYMKKGNLSMILIVYIMHGFETTTSVSVHELSCNPINFTTNEYSSFRKADTHAIRWEEDNSKFLLQKNRNVYTVDEAKSIMNDTCLICIGDSLVRRLCATLSAFLENRTATITELKLTHNGGTDYRRYKSPLCMIFYWSALIDEVDVNSVAKITDTYLKKQSNKKFFFLLTVGVHHFVNRNEFINQGKYLVTKFPHVLHEVLGTMWTKNSNHLNLNRHFIWRTAPGTMENQTDPIHLATWASNSVEIVYNVTRSMGYSISSTDPTCMIPPKHHQLPTVHLLDHYSHLEPVTYGPCRDFGDLRAHFGEKAR